MAHFFITLRPPTPLHNAAQKLWWNCSKLLIKVCFCLNNNKPVSGVTEEAGFLSLSPVRLCDWGYWDYSASQCAHLLWDLTVCILQLWPFSLPFRQRSQCQTEKSPFFFIPSPPPRRKMLLYQFPRQKYQMFNQIHKNNLWKKEDAAAGSLNIWLVLNEHV